MKGGKVLKVIHLPVQEKERSRVVAWVLKIEVIPKKFDDVDADDVLYWEGELIHGGVAF